MVSELANDIPSLEINEFKAATIILLHKDGSKNTTHMASSSYIAWERMQRTS